MRICFDYAGISDTIKLSLAFSADSLKDVGMNIRSS